MKNRSEQISKQNYVLDKRLITLNDVSHYLSLKPQTIRNKLSAGTFPILPIKIGGKLLWDKRKIDKFIDRAKPQT